MPSKRAAKKSGKKQAGRPSDYTEELGAEICRRIAIGETLTKICRPKTMPDRSTVWRWTEGNPDFRNALARAREVQSWSWADEAIDIADGAGRKAKGMPGTGEAGAKVQAEKLRIDARKWLIAKLNPKQFGEKITQEISGPDGGPVKTESDFRPTPEDEAVIRRIAEARGRLQQPRDEGKEDS